MVKYSFLNNGLIMPGEWITVAQKILSLEGTVIVLGKTDSGKTSLIRQLAQFLARRNRKIGWIDADIGQSTLGPPGTVGMTVLDCNSLSLMDFPVMHLFFVGVISPEKCVDKFIDGVCLLHWICQSYHVDAVLMDTTGLVAGTLGAYIKGSLIRRIKPIALIAIQFNDELEHILAEYENETSISIFRLKPYQGIRSKTWPERRNRRRSQFKEYFKDYKLMKIDFSDGRLGGISLGYGSPIEDQKVEYFNWKYQAGIVFSEANKKYGVFVTDRQPKSFTKDIIVFLKEFFKVQSLTFIPQRWFESLLISLNSNEGLSNGLGILEKIDFSKKLLTAYLPRNISVDHHTQIEMGKLKVTLDGMELPYLEPKIW